MPKTKVVNLRHSKYDVFIGRPGKWGNPFIIGRDGTREECVEKFRRWIRTNGSYLLKDLYTLIGKRLGCYCTPLLCHGNVYVELIQEAGLE